MAYIVARTAFDLARVNFNEIYENTTEYDVSLVSANATMVGNYFASVGLQGWADHLPGTVNSALTVDWADGGTWIQQPDGRPVNLTGDWYSMLLVGNGLGLTESEDITGTISCIAEIDCSDQGSPVETRDRLTYAIGDLAIDATSLARVMATPGTADDRALIASVLSGNDTMQLSNGIDRVDGYSGNDTIHGAGGNDRLSGGTGHDRITGDDGQDFVFGGAGNDNLSGGAGNDTLTGEAGDDQVSGDAGHDSLSGAAGNDSLAGGAGNDQLIGGAGRDLLLGGADNDRFIFTAITDTTTMQASADRILDFEQGHDRIDLQAMDASSILSGNQTFSFTGTQSDGIAPGGSIRYQTFDQAGTANDFTMIYLDTDNDPTAEAVIRLNGLVQLTAADFVL